MVSKELLKRITRKIETMPVIDLHCHLNCGRVFKPKHGQLKASNLTDILFYHFVQAELVSSGMPIEKLSEKINPEERVKNALPYLKHIRNTSTYWSLRKIFSDLYGLKEDITGKNWEIFYEKVLQSNQKKNWAEEVLLDKAKIKHFVTPVINRNPKKNPEFASFTYESAGIYPALFDFEDLFSHLQSLLKIKSADSLKEAVNNFFKNMLKEEVSSITTWIPCDFKFFEVKKNEIDTIFKKKKSSFSKIDKAKLLSFALGQILKCASEKKFPVFMPIGAKVVNAYPITQTGYSISEFSSSIGKEISLLACRYPQVEFLMLSATINLCQELAIVAKMCPNVYVMGYWWHCLYPTYIERMLSERLEILPANKIIGFFSDAYCVEWSYGKLSLIKKVLAKVLTEKVQEGYFSEDFAIELVQKILYENPERIFRI